MSVDVTKERLQKALNVSKNRLENLEKEYSTDSTAIPQYRDCLSKSIDIEKINIQILEEKINEIQREEKVVEKINEYKEHEYSKNFNKVFYNLNNFERLVLNMLLVIHDENMNLLQLNLDKESYDKISKINKRTVNVIFEECLGIKFYD